MSGLAPLRASSSAADVMPLHGIDHVEWWVGNAKQAAYVFVHALGFEQLAYAGLETGQRDHVSYVVGQGDIRFVLTGALRGGGPVAEHHHRHGDGVRDIALAVPDVDAAWIHARAQGAAGVEEPHDIEDEHGTVRRATIATFGDTVHTFVDRSAYDGPFLPGFVTRRAGRDAGLLLGIDHVVGNVPEMGPWVAFYERVLGMRELAHFSGEAVSTEYSALMSKVVSSGDGVVKFPINEPATGRRRSQVEEYLEFYDGPGAQHVALTTADIIGTVAELRRRGVEFLSIPDSYYDDLPDRVPEAAGRLAELRAQGILVDRDDEGHLLQVFTAPSGDRPTTFFEVIERHGARGFGEGNFKALFQALEREQERRGNL
ncbi:MAG TPA: 4-hydroxyphenylpyruvate dioxygenase [Baekduia sp.]|nr:4-hydroxyphenylpyruvate dioxygenase [Baekduia sp.]